MLSIILFSSLLLLSLQISAQSNPSSPVEFLADGKGGLIVVAKTLCQTSPGNASLVGFSVYRYPSQLDTSSASWIVCFKLKFRKYSVLEQPKHFRMFARRTMELLVPFTSCITLPVLADKITLFGAFKTTIQGLMGSPHLLLQQLLLAQEF